MEEFFHLRDLNEAVGDLTERAKVVYQGTLNLDKSLTLKQFRVEWRHELNIGQTGRRSRFRWQRGCAYRLELWAHDEFRI